MGHAIVETGTLRATIYGPPQLYGRVVKKEEVTGTIGLPDIINYNPYTAGNGISVEHGVISVDFSVIDCGTSTTVI